MTSANKNSKSSAQLKKEVENEIDKVDQDLQVMESKLSPGQIIDDLIFQGHQGSISEMTRHLASHPVGSSFLTLGTLLLARDNESTFSTSGKLSEVTSKMGQETSGKVEQLKSKAEELTSKIKSSVKGSTSEIKDNSLSFMALGFGLGAITGGTIPISSKEEEMLNQNFSTQLSSLSEDLENAVKESASILRQELTKNFRAA